MRLTESHAHDLKKLHISLILGQMCTLGIINSSTHLPILAYFAYFGNVNILSKMKLQSFPCIFTCIQWFLKGYSWKHHSTRWMACSKSSKMWKLLTGYGCLLLLARRIVFGTNMWLSDKYAVNMFHPHVLNGPWTEQGVCQSLKGGRERVPNKLLLLSYRGTIGAENLCSMCPHFSESFKLSQWL